MIAGAPAKSAAQSVPAAAARELSAVLRDPRTYGREAAQTAPEITLAVRFEDWPHYTDVGFCLDYSELVVYRDGRPVGHRSFAPGKARLLAALRHVFPQGFDTGQ
jgi:hypothetical protein